MKISNYYDPEFVRDQVLSGRHREVVGGLWEEIGTLAFDYLVQHGLTPETRILDIGCGCLRVGVRLVEFLEPGRYYGVDLSEDLLRAGYEVELAREDLQGKLPREHLLCDGDFAFERLPGDPVFDMAIAQSLFTHLPLNHIRLCLTRLAPSLVPGGRFLATVFHCSESQEWARPIHHARGGITSFPTRDPYHYRFGDLLHCASGLAWSVGEPADWNHPRDQAIVAFTRIDEDRS